MIDINKFCAIEDIRYYLNSPFLIGDKLAASDGAIIVLIQNDGTVDYQRYPNPSDCDRVIKIIDSADDWVSVDKSDIVFPEQISCDLCAGTGNASIEEICRKCHGTGIIDEYTASVEICGLKVQAKYIRLTIDEENLQFSPEYDRYMLVYRCGNGVTGAIMALRY